MSDDEIIKTLDSKAKHAEITEAGDEIRIDPTEVDQVRNTPNAPYLANYDQWVGNSRVLGENLTAAGRPKPGPGYQAHHIIPSNEAPEELRLLLRRHELDINGEFNGVWLPTGRNTPNLGAEIKHEFLTGSQEYFVRLQTILIREEPLTKNQVIDALRKIAGYLDRAKLPPPKL